jgi:UDP-N-acetylmuramate dehydrogenase
MSWWVGLESIVRENVPLSGYTWYRLGGPARWFVQPQTCEQLQTVVRRCRENQLPMYVLGGGANLLVNDAGVTGVVVRLGAEPFRMVTIDGDTITAGAGADLNKLVLRGVREGITGMEPLAGIPGTVGGGVKLNCGGQFGDIGALVHRVQVMEADGEIHDRQRDHLVFSYRRSNVTAPLILEAEFHLGRIDPQEVLRRVREIWMYKKSTQPLAKRSAGCVFKNPRQLSAGALIDQAGLKGMQVGGAQVSTRHANFIVANPGASAADVLRLIDIIRERVYERFDIHLELEIQVW